MIYIYWIFVLFASTYFVVRRRFDYFTFSFFSAIVYFFPALYGYTGYMSQGEWLYVHIGMEVYLIFLFVLFSILLSSIQFDLLVGRALNYKNNSSDNMASLFLLALGLVCGISVLLMIYFSAGTVFSPDKADVLSGLGRWHILFYSSAMIGFVLSWLSSKWFWLLFFGAALVFNLYLGFRSNLAIALMGVAVLYLSEKGIRNKKFFLIVPLVIFFAFFMLVYKSLGYAIKAGIWDLIWERVTDPEFYNVLITRAEPFLTQHILNSVVSENYKTNSDHIYSVLHQLLVFSNELFGDPASFNDYFQKDLFPEVDYGMASNIWAQAWSALGWPGIIIITIFIQVTAFAGNLTLLSKGLVLKSIAAPILCYWLFYAHRNDLAYTINLGKRIFAVALFCFFIVVCCKYLARVLRLGKIIIR